MRTYTHFHHSRVGVLTLQTMNGEEKKERWLQLCEQAAVEKDPEKLLELCQEISRLLDEKEKSLKRLQ